MAFESEMSSTQEKRGPKLFTEYSTNTLAALVCQIGNAFLALSLSALLVFVVLVAMAIMPAFAPFIAILSIVASLQGMYQGYVGYRMHKGDVPVRKAIQADQITIFLCVVAIIASFLIDLWVFLVGAQLLIGMIVVDIIAIYLLRSEEVTRELEWWKQE